MRTPEQQRQWEQQCYGCSEAELKESVDGSITAKLAGHGMVAMSMLSDAQEEVERGMRERARQTINRAKWVIRTYLMKENAK